MQIEAPLEKIQRLHELQQRLAEREASRPSLWFCGRRDCDGEPHRGWEWKHARGKQHPPGGEWFVWLVMAGRGWGKTVTGAQWLAHESKHAPRTQWAVVTQTLRDARRICFPALVDALGDEDIAEYNRSDLVITLTNGAEVFGFGAEKPAGPTGLNLAGAWLDELALWPYPSLWHESLVPALRTPTPRPHVVVTSTPRPTDLFRSFLTRAEAPEDELYRLTRGSTFENASNLSPEALAELQVRYAGTRLGRQELEGDFLEDVDGALVTIRQIDDARRDVEELPRLVRIVVAVDPAVSSGEDADETGIVVCAKGQDGHGYVLDDRTVWRYTPEQWATAAVGAYHDWKADRLVAEKNQGFDLVEHVIRSVDRNIAYRGVVAKHGKRLRAEPITARYEQGLMHHVGTFPTLEDQLTRWVPDSGESPDRLDALVHGMTELGFASASNAWAAKEWLESLAPPCPRCGQPNPPNTVACSKCGRELGGEPEQSERFDPWRLPERQMPDQTRAALDMLRSLPPTRMR